MTHEFRPIPGDEFHAVYVIQPQDRDGPEDARFQKVISRHPVYTHRPAAKWVQVKRGGSDKPFWELLIWSEEIPLAEVAKASDNFEKLGMDSMRWLVGHHNLKLVEPPRVAGDDKTDRGERANMLRSIREFAKSEAGKSAKPAEVAPAVKTSDVAQAVKDMTDGELEEAAAMLGELPVKWGSMRRQEREAVYAKAMGQKRQLQEASA